MDIQVREVIAFAALQSLVVARFYRDEGQSGAAENRQQLNKLLRACERGDIGVVIIPALDRLSRDVRIAENLFYRFDQLGVRVLIADMPHYNGDNRRDVLIRQIREAIAEENRKDIIERLWKGRQERVRKGRVPGGNVPYGYRRIGKRWVPDHRESKIVRVVFEMADSAASATEIAAALNRQGFTRRNGRAWTPRQVLDLLSRRKLYESGVFQYGNVEGSDANLVLLNKGA